MLHVGQRGRRVGNQLAGHGVGDARRGVRPVLLRHVLDLVPREHRIAEFERPRVRQDGLRRLHGVMPLPVLVEPDPQGELSDLARPRLHLDPEEVGRPDLLHAELRVAGERLQFAHDLVLDVLEHVHGDVQEVPRSTGGVEDT